MIFQKYILITRVELTNSEHNDIIFDICYHYNNPRFLSIALKMNSNLAIETIMHLTTSAIVLQIPFYNINFKKPSCPDVPFFTLILKA